MQFHFGAVLVFLIVSAVFIFGNLLLGWLLRPSRPYEKKQLVYECGEPAIGTSWIRYNIRFYTIALVYLIFDVEVVFLLPALLVLKELRMLAFVEVLTFVGILTIGLVYAWHYGSLDWVTDKPVEKAGGEAGEGEVQELGLGV